MATPKTVINAFNKLEYDSPLPRDNNFTDIYTYFTDAGQSLLLKSGSTYLLLYFDFADIVDEISDETVSWTFGEGEDRFILTMYINASLEDSHHAFILKKNKANRDYLQKIKEDGKLTLECIALLYGDLYKLRQARLTLPGAVLQLMP